MAVGAGRHDHDQLKATTHGMSPPLTLGRHRGLLLQRLSLRIGVWRRRDPCAEPPNAAGAENDV